MLPNIFTTPELRFQYPVEIIRKLIFYFTLLSLLLGSLSFIYFKRRVASSIGILFAFLAVICGWSTVEAGNTVVILHLGLDWFVMSLLIYGTIFIIIEKLFPLRKEQLILRDEWDLDMKYYFVNHLIGWIILIAINWFIQNYLGFLIWPSMQEKIAAINIVLQVAIIFLVTDFIQYWIHRAYHQIPFLWRIHAVHHSAPTMDWLAGSRMHIVEMFMTRWWILIAAVLLGFSEAATNIYVIIVSIWATFIHLNINIKPSFLRKIFVLPNFHHWHHSKACEAMDKNFAWQLAFYDVIFWTALFKDEYPEAYWICSPKNFPKSFWKQTLYAFRKRKKEVKVPNS